MQNINDALERASTPRRSHAPEYTGPVNEHGQPDTTGSREMGTKIYKLNPLYKRYTGQWKNGEFEGMGNVEFIHGDTYEGHFSDGMLHGQGRYVFKNGDTLEGEFSFDAIKNGKMTNPDVVFEGEFVNGTPYKGKKTLSDGDVFEGFYYPNGVAVGKETWANGVIFSGDFKNGILNGFGRVSVPGPDGHAYEGQFKDGKMHGKGKLFFRDGKVFVGTFKDDAMYQGKMLTGGVADADSGPIIVDGGKRRRRTHSKQKKGNKKSKNKITAKLR
jgi:hypothetical protein